MPDKAETWILHITDDPEEHDLFRSCMASHNFLIDCVYTGDEGLCKAAARTYEVVVIKDHLGKHRQPSGHATGSVTCERTGLDYAKLLIERFPEQRVVMLLGENDQKRIVESLMAGVSNCLVASVIDRFADVVSSVVSRHAYDGAQRRIGRETERLLRLNETRIRDLAMSVADWYWEADADMVITFMSESIFDTIGIPATDYIGLPIGRLSETADSDAGWDDLIQTMRDHRPFRDYEYSRTIADGKTVWIRSSGVPAFDSEGQFIGYRGAGTDITKVKQIALTGIEVESRFRSFIEHSPSAILIKAISGRYLHANTLWYHWFNPDRKNILTMSAHDFFNAEVADALAAQDMQVLERRESVTTESLVPLTDGTTLPTLIQKFPIMDKYDEIVAIGCVVTDISEQKHMEEDLRLALIQAEQANRSKSEFLATMSHELRTPLNAIIGFSEILIGQYFGDLGSMKYVEYAGDIHHSGQHLLGMISEVLDISTIELGKRDLSIEPVNVAALVENCITLVRNIADDSHKNLSGSAAADLVSIDADERALKRVLINLLTNSLKFSDPGDSVTLTANRRGGEAVFVVHDTGAGIDKDILDRITEPFVRGHQSSMTAQEGVGLGLSIVKTLVEAHGGTLKIESTYGHGTCVTVRMPLTH